MKVGWLGRALILIAMEQVGKALDARRARRSEHPSPDSQAGIEQPSADGGDGQDGDQGHFKVR